MNIDVTSIWFVFAILFFALAAVGMFVSVILFAKFQIPTLIKDSKGVLEQKQIAEIRANSNNAAKQKNKVNVFEELEKKAKPKRSNTQSLNVRTSDSTDFSTYIGRRKSHGDFGTTVLKRPAQQSVPGFVMQKDLTFVCTSEVL